MSNDIREVNKFLGCFDGNCDKELMELATRIDSSSMDCPTPTPGTCEEKFNNGKFCFSPREEKPPVHSGISKKRKRASNEESDDFKDRLFSMLETNSKVLTAHMESQNLNSQLDRNQRREQAESIVSVLGRLADALGRIAERL